MHPEQRAARRRAGAGQAFFLCKQPFLVAFREDEVVHRHWRPDPVKELDSYSVIALESRNAPLRQRVTSSRRSPFPDAPFLKPRPAAFAFPRWSVPDVPIPGPSKHAFPIPRLPVRVSPSHLSAPRGLGMCLGPLKNYLVLAVVSTQRWAGRPQCSPFPEWDELVLASSHEGFRSASMPLAISDTARALRPDGVSGTRPSLLGGMGTPLRLILGVTGTASPFSQTRSHRHVAVGRRPYGHARLRV